MAEQKRTSVGRLGAFRKIRRVQSVKKEDDVSLGEGGSREEREEEEATEGRRNQTRFREMMLRSEEREKQRLRDKFHLDKGAKEQDQGQELEEVQGPPVTLMVQGRRLECSAKVIKCSALFTDLMHLVESEEEAIPVPDFISRQIMLDLVEMVEKGDTVECAHLVLVSLSYLLDFLIAMDFLGCTQIKETVEKRIKEHIGNNTWREIFDYTKDIIGLYPTTCDSLKFICRKLVEGEVTWVANFKGPGEKEKAPGPASPVGSSNQVAIMEGKPEAYDPYLEDYLNFPAPFFLVLLRDDSLLPTFKFHLLRLWAGRHEERKEDIFTLAMALPFKGLADAKVAEMLLEVRTWGLSLEAMEEVEDRAGKAKLEREREVEDRKEQEKAHKRQRRERRFIADFPMGIMFGGNAAGEEGVVMEEILNFFQ